MNLPDLQTLAIEPLDGGIAVLRVNRPDRMNAQTVTMFHEYGIAARALRDSGLRALILAGAGDRAFCAGFDLDELDVITRFGVRDFLKFLQTAAGGITAIRHLPFPVIAAVHGAAVGGGLALALAADIRLAAPTAKFSAAFVRVGLSMGELGTSFILSRLVGPGRAAEIGYTGRIVGATEAVRIGLANRIVPSGQLFAEALAMATAIAAHPADADLARRPRRQPGGPGVRPHLARPDPAWTGDVAVANADGTASSFAHMFQSGRYEGAIRVDGREVRVDGWYGQRDRSRGVRTMSGGQGLHLWVQAQFPDRSVGFLTAESRGHEQLLLEGAVMHEDGRLDPVTDVRHDLSFDDGLDLHGGLLEVTTRDGAVYRIAADAAARGGYMSGGGYGGQHGRPMGRGHVEHDVYPLDGSVSPRTLDSALTDRLTAFTWDRTPGCGIFEFALTRSPSYVYKPTLP